METVLTSDPFHRELELLLPWYVNGRLDAEEARQVEAHLAECPACQRDVAELARLLHAHAQTVDERPVDDAKMHALLDKIEGGEKLQPQSPKKRDTAERSSLWESLSRFMGSWLGAQPALVVATIAALSLVVVSMTMMRLDSTDGQYGVLSSSEPETEEFRLKLRFEGAPGRAEVEKLIASGVRERQVQGAYRIDQREGGEYVVTFGEKPTVDAVSGLISEWRNAPNVAEVSIDGSAAP
jgi:anti-sigma-K factor RskA